MKVPIIFNSEAANVLQHRGREVREFYDEEIINWIKKGLQNIGHEVEVIEGDGHLYENLCRFFGDELGKSWPGIALNMAYGVQGRVRYTHVPGLLEMLGIPYIGSSPLGHALCADKATTKIILSHFSLPTSPFALLRSADDPLPDFEFPVVVKPKAESTSLGIHLVKSREELRKAVEEVINRFSQPVLIEKFLPGREVNVSFIGNDPRLAMQPMEVKLAESSEEMYTQADKTHEHQIKVDAADLPEAQVKKIRHISKKALDALECLDWARIDFRADEEGNFQILEINSMPHLSPDSSMYRACTLQGWDLEELLRQIIKAAEIRYASQGERKAKRKA
ncbi:MAG: ATP-grasp domain-containing protein [Calditrichia bacterium]